QRAKALSAWNPTLGDSSNSVKLLAVLSMAYREFLRQAEGIQTHCNAVRQDRRQLRSDDLPRHRCHPEPAGFPNRFFNNS
ncbi:hypothetical protein, partial [Bradyrhizobium sp. Ec3.3]|uniref:hypothetical protein n=1 Tax=Bradyrhizobium sp. Ec3.3 TaxID=189753 RepID=UPI001AEBD57C